MMEIRRNKRDLKDSVINRKINRAVHFTSVTNLENIFKYGLMSVKTLNQKNIIYYYNDEGRYDNCTDAICLSIKRPNYKTFWSYRLEYPGVAWVVLGIRKKVLWEKDCAFCVENAASNKVRYVPINQRKGVQGFNKLFDEYPGKPSRKELGIGTALPTHPQAEVLVFDKIEPAEIFGVAFENTYTMNKFRHLIPEDKLIEVQKWMFEPRKDYAHWQR